MFDLGVTGGDRSARWRRLSTTMTQVDRAKRGRNGRRPGQPRCCAATRGRPPRRESARRELPRRESARRESPRRGPLRQPARGPARTVAAPGAARGRRRAGRRRLSPGAGSQRPARPAPDRVTDFGQDWKFALVNPYGITDPSGAYANAQDPGFNDSGWQQLDVPHDWSIELAPVDNASTSSATGFLPGGLAWYRKHFTLPKSLAGQRISIEFDGVYRNSDVYLNGKLLGNHPYAYTGFSYDLTGLVHTDGVTEDVIAVSCADQQPSSRWYSGDGIFRNVYLVTTGPVHVARHGTFVTTPGLPGTLSSGYATVQVAIQVTNDRSAAASVQVAVTLTGPDGKTAAQGTATV